MNRTMLSESILEGEKTRLRPMEPNDLPFFVDWLADREVRRWLAEIDRNPPTLEDEIDWYEGRRADPDCVMWAIDRMEGGFIGSIELRVNQQANRAELGIVIGDKDAWNQGLGTDAVRTVLRYGFSEAKLNRVELTTDESNVRGLRCYEKCGFVREGVLRKHRRISGRYANTVMMSILGAEWKAANAGRRRRKDAIR